MNNFKEKEITGKDLSEILSLNSEDICITLFSNYFFKTSPTDPPRFEVNDYFRLPISKFNTKKEVWTTIGIYLINLHLIQPKFSSIFGYINKPFNGEVIEFIEDNLSNALYNNKITTDDMVDYYNRLQWLGHDKLSILSPSITPSLLKPPPGLMELKRELFKKYKKELDPSNPNNAIVASKIESELIAYAENYLKNSDGYENFASKSKININNNYKTMNIMKGPLLNSYTGKYHVNASEYNTGITKDEYVSISDSSVLGSHARAINTARGGYLAKKSNQALNAIQAGPKNSDCKTTKTYSVYIYPEMKNDYLNRYIIENGSLIELTEENIDKYINKTVNMRSPIYCKMKEPCFCNICIGNQPYLLGLDKFGLAINRISNKLLNLSMKKFHDLTIKVEKINTETLFDFTE